MAYGLTSKWMKIKMDRRQIVVGKCSRREVGQKSSSILGLFKNRNMVCGLDRPRWLTPISPHSPGSPGRPTGRDGRVILPRCRRICDFLRTHLGTTRRSIYPSVSARPACSFPPHPSSSFLLLLPIYREGPSEESICLLVAERA